MLQTVLARARGLAAPAQGVFTSLTLAFALLIACLSCSQWAQAQPADSALKQEAIRFARTQLSTHMLTCGEHTYLWIPVIGENTVMLGEIHNLQLSALDSLVSPADKLNGVLYSGAVTVSWEAHKLNLDGAWTDWHDPGQDDLFGFRMPNHDMRRLRAAFNIVLTKTKAGWTVEHGLPNLLEMFDFDKPGMKPLDCASVNSYGKPVARNAEASAPEPTPAQRARDAEIRRSLQAQRDAVRKYVKDDVCGVWAFMRTGQGVITPNQPSAPAAALLADHDWPIKANGQHFHYAINGPICWARISELGFDVVLPADSEFLAKLYAAGLRKPPTVSLKDGKLLFDPSTYDDEK